MIADEQKAAVVNACCATALIRAMGMQAENQQREHGGFAMAYNEQAFLAVIEEERIHWNAVHETLFQ